jgi:hypothetical protein
MNERNVAIGILAVVAAGLLALFFATYEKEEYEVRIAPTGEAARNPLFAAQRLLTGLGYEAGEREEFAPSLELPPPGGTVLALFYYDYMAADERKLLLQWGRDGGHLITEIQPRYGRPYDPVFTPVGIEAYVRSDPDALEFDEDGNPVERDDAEQPEIADDAGAAPGREAWGAVQQDNLVSIQLGETEPLWSVHDQHGVFATQIAYDNGTVTALADLSIFTNYHIAKQDHAFLLTQIIGPASSAGAVWLVRSTDFPSLWSLLTEHLSEVLIAGGILLLMCLWWASQRFGPRLKPPQRARKAFIEHIEANGRFLWRHSADQELLGSTQQSFLRDAHRRHAPLRRLDEHDRNLYLARVCGLLESEVASALSEDSARRHGDFLTKIQLIKTMWNRL